MCYNSSQFDCLRRHFSKVVKDQIATQIFEVRLFPDSRDYFKGELSGELSIGSRTEQVIVDRHSQLV
jgi:hypothetical protein